MRHLLVAHLPIERLVLLEFQVMTFDNPLFWAQELGYLQNLAFQTNLYPEEHFQTIQIDRCKFIHRHTH